MNVQDVVTTNQALVRRASDLNARAGEAIFPIPSKDQLAARIETALQGATCVADIADPAGLVLPALDETKVDQVLANSPDEVDLLGGLSVEYRRDSPPLVRVPSGLKHNWKKLPDEGVRLPDGRLVEVRVEGYLLNSPSDVSVPMVKAKIRDHLNQQQWRGWVQPKIEQPDVHNPDATLSLQTRVYGTCAQTGEDLIAYGHCQFYQTWNTIDSRTDWTTDKVEAEAYFTESVRIFQQYRSVLAEEVARSQAKAQAAAEREAKFAAGRERIKNVNVRRLELGWEEMTMSASVFYFGSKSISYDDEAGLQEVETAVAREEECREQQQPAAPESLAALAAHFNK